MPYIRRNESGEVAGVVARPHPSYPEYVEEEVEIVEIRTGRDLRQEEYIRQLSPEGTFEKTIGDCIDALIKAVKGDPTDLDSLVAKIEVIRSQIPE